MPSVEIGACEDFSAADVDGVVDQVAAEIDSLNVKGELMDAAFIVDVELKACGLFCAA